jgi:GT2 family glycosyltransferase
LLQPDLSIVIVNYHSLPELSACLSSLAVVRGECAFEVIVVDNGSDNDSLERAQREQPWCRYLALGENRGFAGACNAGLEITEGRHAMLLNPDTEVLSGALPKLVLALDDHPTWGIVGSRMVTPPRPPVNGGEPYCAARRFPTPWYLFSEATGLARLFPRTKLFNGYLYGEHDPQTLDEVEQIEGSALMISERARQEVGNLDPQFFIFFEEVDWCQRVRAAGFEIHVVPDAIIRHHRSTTMSRFFVSSRVHHAESALKYFRKHHGERGVSQLRRWMIAGLWIRALVLRLALLVKHDPKLRIRFEGTQAMRDVYRRGLAP